MIPMLAQIENVSGESLKTWVLIAAGFLAIGHYAQEMFWGKKLEQPIATSVSGTVRTEKHLPCASRDELLAAKKDIDHLFKIAHAIERNVQDKLSKLDREVGELKKIGDERTLQFAALNHKVDDVDDKVANVPHQTIALLRNAGVIKG